jgi:hypothetical protein
MRVLMALGLVSLLVWVVPMVLLSKKQAELVSSVAPAGTSGGSSAGEAAADPIGKANDLQAQNTMNNAIRVAQVWYAENGTYAGFGPDQAAEYDPSIAFTSGPPAAGSVTMRVTPETVVMVTLAPKGPLCAAAALDVVSTGRADATTPQQCEGGWG